MADLTLNEYSGLMDEEIKARLLEEQGKIFQSNHSLEPSTGLRGLRNASRRFAKARHFISRYLKAVSFKKIPMLKREEIY